MNKIAQFHKVSFEQFKESWDDSFPGASEEEIKEKNGKSSRVDCTSKTF